MRIRKRWPPNPQDGSASDQQTQRQAQPTLHPNKADLHNPLRSTPNLLSMLILNKNTYFSSDGPLPHHPKVLRGKEEEINGERGHGSSNLRNANGCELVQPPPLSSSSSTTTTTHQVMWIECEGEKAEFSIKKKRGERGDGAEGIDEDGDDGVANGELKKKGKGNGSVGDPVAEGSRCSRVNGRGWRCSQQTLVGYALCEHHLGKGRLRSMSSVRSRSIAVSSGADGSALSSSCELEEGALREEDEKVEDVKKQLKKKKMVGRVKARSINSLLDQRHQ